MKNKFLVTLAIIALVGFVLSLDNGSVSAQQQGPPEQFDSSKAAIPVEYSTDTLCAILFGDVDFLGARSPQQVLFTVPPDPAGFPPPANTFNFGGEIDVDALANGRDAFEHDPKSKALPLPRDHIAVYMEDIAHPAAFQGPLWSHNSPPPAQLDWNGNTLNDTLELDGLEVWGPLAADDADFYSLVGDPGAVCVFSMAGGPYIPQPVILAAVTALGYAGPPEIDLDALMVWDEAPVDEWGAGDEIIFSIREAGNWDGGEIVVLPWGAAPFFLHHDSHDWDTDFNVASAFRLVTPPVLLEFPVDTTIPDPGSLPRLDSLFRFSEIHVDSASDSCCPQISPCCTLVIHWQSPPPESCMVDTVHIKETIVVNLEGAKDNNDNGVWDYCDQQLLHFKIGDDSCKYFWYHVARVGHIKHPPELVCRKVLYKVPKMEEVDGIEAYPIWFQQTPTLTQWGLLILVALLIFSTVFVILRRRKGIVAT